uniref:(northern house mosquito) hypothetical protein n=1 Tax=Culex pipiens TaxID=7175 RepID=A0A8D8IY44_CULPI
MRRFSESREYLYWRWRIRTRGRICVTSGMDDGRQLVTTNSACRTRPWLVIPAIGGRSPPQWLSSFLIILEKRRELNGIIDGVSEAFVKIELQNMSVELERSCKNNVGIKLKQNPQHRHREARCRGRDRSPDSHHADLAQCPQPGESVH